MTDNPPTAGVVTVTGTVEPLSTYLIDNYADVVLGVHDDATPVVHVVLGRVVGQTATATRHEFTDAAILEDLSAAFAAAADHLRNSDG